MMESIATLGYLSPNFMLRYDALVCESHHKKWVNGFMFTV